MTEITLKSGKAYRMRGMRIVVKVVRDKNATDEFCFKDSDPTKPLFRWNERGEFPRPTGAKSHEFDLIEQVGK